MEHVPFMMNIPSPFETTVVQILQRHDAELHQSSTVAAMVELRQQIQMLQQTLNSALSTIADLSTVMQERAEEHEFLTEEIYKLKKGAENG